MNFSATKKTFIFLLLLPFFCNFLPSPAESNFKAPVLNSTDLAFNGPVRAIVRDEMTGIVYVGGQFTQVGQNSGSGVPIDTFTGKAQAIFPKVNGTVLAVIPDGSGGWYIGGYFTSVGGMTRKTHLAHILSDGTVDKNWNPDTNDYVNVLAIKDSTIYVGGNFTTIGGIERNHLAAIGTDGILQSWNPNVGRTDPNYDDNPVKALAISGSTVYVGGSFTTIGGIERNNLAAIGTDGTLLDWNPSASDGYFGGTVKALAISDSIVYVGGTFRKIAGGKRNNLAAIGTDGTLLSWNPGANTYVEALAINGSTIYVGGYFTKIGRKRRNHLAAIGTDGVLQNWNPGTDDYVNALAISGSTIYASGRFESIRGKKRNRLAAIGTDGVLQNWNPNVSDSVLALAIKDSTIYVGGTFLAIGGTERNNLAAIGTDGTLLSWNPGVTGNRTLSSSSPGIYALAIKDSTIYVGGHFKSIRGTERSHLAAIGTDGTLQSWNPNVGHTDRTDPNREDSIVKALAISGSTVYVGGTFPTIGGIERNNLAAISTDGTLLSWNPNVGRIINPNYADSTVKALAISGSTIYVGGYFPSIGGTERNHLAAISTDGTLLSWNPNVSGSFFGSRTSSIKAIAISGSTVYVGGTFPTIGGIERNNLAAISTDGTLLSWNPNANNGSVNALAINDSIIYVGGELLSIGGTERNRLAAISTDGTLLSWNPNADSSVETLAISGSTIYVGGFFTLIDNEVISDFASFNIPEDSN